MRSDTKILKMMTHIQKLTRTKRGRYRTSPIAVAAATWLISASSVGAVDIQSITTPSSSFTDGADSTVGNVTYRNQSQSITAYTTTGSVIERWESAGGTAPTFSLRRSGAGEFTDRQVVWSRREGTGESPYTVLSGQPTTTQAALDLNNIFSGTDNLFTNQGNNEGNNSDVERADIVFGSGVSSANNLGVSIFERGGNTSTNNTAHDGFRIAAITAVNNVTGKHTYGGNILTFGTTTANRWGKTGLTGNQRYVVLNNSSGSAAVSSVLSNDTQEIGGTVIRLTDLVSPGTTVFGYSLFATDVTTNNTADLSDWTNSTYFKTNTADSAGGLDLVAADLGVSRSRVVPFGLSPSLGILILGAAWGTQSLWKRYRIKPVDVLRAIAA